MTAPAKTSGPRLTDSQLERAYVRYGADIACDVADLVRRSHAPGWSLTKTGLTSLDKAITIAPQTVTVFAARPQHGKSMMLKVLARQAIRDLEARGGYEAGERVFFVTLEEPGGKLGVQLGGMTATYRDILRGEADEDLAIREAIGLARSLRGLCVIEHPGIVEGRIAPAVSAGIVTRAIERAHADDGLRPAMILLDYLQLMKADGSDGTSAKTKTEHVMAASNGAVRLSRAFNCPVVMAVQAGRDTDTRAIKLPTLADMQHSSAIEQDADTILGLWRPWVDHADDVLAGTAKPINLGGTSVSIVENLMVLGVIKTRNDAAGGQRFGAHVDPVRFRAYPIDTRLEARDVA